MALPPGWDLRTIGDVCLPPQYGWTTSAANIGSLRLLRTTDITSGSINWDTVPYCTAEPSNVEKYLLHDGDIVISRAGSVGFSYLIKNPLPAVFASYLIRFRPIINEKYVAYFLQSPIYWQAISENSLGIAIPNVNASKLKKIPIPVPPLPEQERIVARIESLFTQLDAGVAGLKRVKAALKRYKASVLKAACEGRLVPQDPSDESAEELLRRILAEKGVKAGILFATESDLPELPKGWVWAALEQLSWDADYGTSQKCGYEINNFPVLRIPNISNGVFDFSDLKFATKPDELNNKKSLSINDLLIIRTNGSRDLIGRSALVRKLFERPLFFASYLIRYRLIDCGEWISTIWNAPDMRRRIERISATTAGQYNVSISSLNKLSIPLPPLPEQHRIIAEVEQRLSVAQEVEAAVSAGLQRANRLHQAILERAFEGRLVPQDPNAEPSSALLKRVQQLELFRDERGE